MNLKSKVSFEKVIKNKQNLISKVEKFLGIKVLVLGDIGIDEYVIGEVNRLSPEAPVPVLEVVSREFKLGLAGNVAQNISSLGGESYLIGLLGQDNNAELLRSEFRKKNVNDRALVVDSQRPTTIKTRFMSGPHHLVRVDQELKKLIDVNLSDQVKEKIRNLVPIVDIVILEDYGKGLLTEEICQFTIKEAHKKNKTVLLDPNPQTPLHYYKNVDILTPNEKEAIHLSGLMYDLGQGKDEFLGQVSDHLLEKLKAHNLIITRGKEGMDLYSNQTQGSTRIPTFARQVYDVTGAGDTVVAAMALALASGCSLEEACILSNFAAGIAVGEIGCVACTQDQIIESIKQF